MVKRQAALFVSIAGFLTLVTVTYPHGDHLVIPPDSVGVYENFDTPVGNAPAGVPTPGK